jgi:hypothetical protein
MSIFNSPPLLFESMHEAEAWAFIDAYEAKHPRAGVWMDRDIFTGRFQVFGGAR